MSATDSNQVSPREVLSKRAHFRPFGQHFGTGTTPVGDSTLVRTLDGALATFWVGSLPPSEAITLWWVVFNQPENCSAPGCGEDDIFIGGDPAQGPNEDQIEAAGIVVGYAAGTIIGGGGTALMVARTSSLATCACTR